MREARRTSWGVLILLFQTFFLFPSAADSSTVLVPEIHRQLKEITDEPIPSLEEVLPTYHRPEKEPISLIVAYLTEDTMDGLPWGRALGSILQWKIRYCPKNLLHMPSVDSDMFEDDVWAPGTPRERQGRSLESMERAYWRLGIDRALTGNVRIGDASFEIDVILSELPSLRRIANLSTESSLEGLPNALSEVSVWVYNELGVELSSATREYLERKTPERFDQLRRYVEILGRDMVDSATNPVQRDLLDLWKEGFDLPRFLWTYLVVAYSTTGGADSERDAFLEEIEARFPGHEGISYLIARNLPVRKRDSRVGEKVSRLKRLITENPRDIIVLQVLSESVAEAGAYLEAVSIALEALERNPRNYRCWWTASSRVNRYAGEIRGGRYYSQIGERVQRLYPSLKSIAAAALDRALEIYPECVGIWYSRMNQIGTLEGASPDFLKAYERLLELSPDEEWVYQTALGFTGPEYGGSPEVLFRILSDASKNLPEAEWPLVETINKGESMLADSECDPGISPADLYGTARRLLEPARRVIRENLADVNQDSLLQIALRNGDKGSGAPLVRAQLLRCAEHPLVTMSPRADNPYLVLAECGVALGDATLTRECLSRYEPIRENLVLDTGEDRYRSIQGIIPFLEGDANSAATAIAEFLQVKNNQQVLIVGGEPIPYLPYLCERYLQLGSEIPLDEQLVDMCKKVLITSSENLKVEGNPFHIGPVNPREEDPFRETVSSKSGKETSYLTSQMFRYLAEGHLAAAKGDHKAAISHYQAALLHQRSFQFETPRDPSILGQLWKRVREEAEK